jgi:NAD(P)-dependent dehydrogenase (short-subunit alcohol dehydrogenase family)
MSGFDVSEKVVWVTGSSRGIGRGVAEHLAAQGASVVVHGRSQEALDEVAAGIEEAAGIEAAAGAVLAVAADVLDEAALAAAVERIASRFGRLDAVIANVGGAAHCALADVTLERFRRQLDLNLTGALAVLQAAHPMLAAAGGAAVLISATAASSATPRFGPYGAAKAALEHLAGSLAAEWGPAVRVNCVSPGLVRTEGSLKSVFRGREELAIRAGGTTAVGRVGEPADIAYACQYLISAAASFVSGAVLVVDGGPTEGPTQRILRALEQ